MASVSIVVRTNLVQRGEGGGRGRDLWIIALHVMCADVYQKHKVVASVATYLLTSLVQ